MNIVDQPLPFKVALKTNDGLWTVKAAFSSPTLAGSYAVGMASSGVDTKVFENRADGVHDVTEECVMAAARALERTQ